jgi:hypothetical protein
MAAASAAIADFSRYSKPPPLGGGVFTQAQGQLFGLQAGCEMAEGFEVVKFL